MEIKIEADVLVKQASEITEEYDTLKTNVLNGKVLSSIEGIRQAWQGDDALRLLSVLEEEYIKELEKNINKLIQFGTDLNEVPNKYEILDSNFASSLR